MDEYKISQNPEDAKKADKAAKAGKKGGPKLPKVAHTSLISPQLILGGAVGAASLVFVGVFVATHFITKTPATTTATGAKKGGTSQTDKGVVPGQTFNDVTKAISDKNPGALKKYYAKTVHVVIPRHTVNQNVSGNSVESLIGDLLNGAQNPWNWHVSAAQLAAWQQGPDGQYFTGNVIVGISQDGTVISLTIDDNGQITTIFIAPVGDLTNPPPAGDTGGGGGTDTTLPVQEAPPVGPNDSD